MGCVLILVIQSMINIGVNVSLFPNKGMPLPFVSYGGTGIIVSCFMIGLVISIYRNGYGVHRSSELLFQRRVDRS